MSPDWNQTIPPMNLLVGTPVRFRSGQEPPGFPCSGKSMFVRPWGDEDNGMCMVVDEAGTSMPVTEACLMVDLGHPLGMFYALSLFYRQAKLPEWKDSPGWQAICIRALLDMTDNPDRNDLAKALSETHNTHEE
jgi:hypothetical protein